MLWKFRVLNESEGQGTVEHDYSILFNPGQIVSVKPIKMLYMGELILGHWVRLANGKKYKATQVPQQIVNLVNDDSSLAPINVLDTELNDHGPELMA